jgi:uncharacterized membrane protein
MDPFDYFLARSQSDPKIEPIKAIDFGIKETLSDVPNYVGFSVLAVLIQMGLGRIPFINIIAILFASLPLQIAHSHYCHLKREGKEVKFMNFFDPFQKTIPLMLFQSLILGMAFIFLLTMIVVAAFFGVELGSAESFTEMGLNQGQIIALGITSLILMAVLLYFLIGLMLAPYFIYFFNINAGQAIFLSRAFVKKNWWQYFIFYLLCGLCILVGFLALFVGIFIAIPVIRLAYYRLFEQAIGEEALNVKEKQEYQ